MLSQIF